MKGLEGRRRQTDRVSDDVAHLARPVGQVAEDDRRQLPDPDGQQTGVEDQRVGDGHHHQEEVGGELEHRLVSEDDEREDVAERSEDDDERRDVQLQQPVSPVLARLRHLLCTHATVISAATLLFWNSQDCLENSLNPKLIPKFPRSWENSQAVAGLTITVQTQQRSRR